MRELKPLLPNTKQPTEQHKGTKRWILAEGRKRSWKQQYLQNSSVEYNFHCLIKLIKTQFLNPGDIYFERDYKHDRSESLYSMHGFMCSFVKLRLDCPLHYNYEVDYAIHDCPFEAELRALLKVGLLGQQAKEISLQPNFPAYWQHVLNYHPAEFIHLI